LRNQGLIRLAKKTWEDIMHKIPREDMVNLEGIFKENSQTENITAY
jgi:hypothetical protein